MTVYILQCQAPTCTACHDLSNPTLGCTEVLVKQCQSEHAGQLISARWCFRDRRRASWAGRGSSNDFVNGFRSRGVNRVMDIVPEA